MLSSKPDLVILPFKAVLAGTGTLLTLEQTVRLLGSPQREFVLIERSQPGAPDTNGWTIFRRTSRKYLYEDEPLLLFERSARRYIRKALPGKCEAKDAADYALVFEDGEVEQILKALMLERLQEVVPFPVFDNWAEAMFDRGLKAGFLQRLDTGGDCRAGLRIDIINSGRGPGAEPAGGGSPPGIESMLHLIKILVGCNHPPPVLEKSSHMLSNVQIEKRRLGKTDLLVTPIGLGMMEFAGGGGLMGFAFPRIPQEIKNATVQAGLDGGVNWFDTAELYGAGVSERSLATALKAAGKKDAEVVVATKWWPLFRTAGNISNTIAARQRFLQGYSISLYMIHQPFSFSSPEAEMDAMARLVEAGKIRSVGVSNFNPARLRRAHHQLQQHGLPLAVNQVRYSLLDRSIERDGTLETAQELGVTIIAYTPLEWGLLSGKYHKDPQLLAKRKGFDRLRLRRGLEKSRSLLAALEEIALRYKATPAQVALNWVIHFHGVSIVTIPGVTNVNQARDNAGALQFKLSGDDLARLDDLSRAIQ